MLDYSRVSTTTLMESNSASAFDIEGYLRRQSSIIDQALEMQLARYPGESQTLFQVLRYGVFSGGKRIRPILTIAAAEIFGADAKHILPFACAVELIHAYSLIHDDLPAWTTTICGAASPLLTRYMAKAWHCWGATRY